MQLDWSLIEQKYGKGAEVPTVAGNKVLQITGVDDRNIYIKSSLWKASLSRENLEKGVELMEEGLIDREPGQFVEDYKIYISQLDTLQHRQTNTPRRTSASWGTIE